MNYMVLQGDILSVLMIGSILILVQVLSECSVFGVDETGVLFYYPI